MDQLSTRINVRFPADTKLHAAKNNRLPASTRPMAAILVFSRNDI